MMQRKVIFALFAYTGISLRIYGPTSYRKQCEIAVSRKVLNLEQKGVKFGVTVQ